MNPILSGEFERWFVKRGIPQFITDYSAREDVLTRALPALSFAFLVSAISAVDLEWAWWAIVLATAAGLGVLVTVWAGINTLRDRPRWALPHSVGSVEIGVFLLVPVFLPLIFGGDLSGAGITFVSQLLVLAVIYGATSYGLVAIARWATMQIVRTLGQTFRLFARALPLLLLGFMFLFINAEAWQSAGTLEGASLAAVVGLFTLLGVVFVITQMAREIPPLTLFSSWAEAAEAAGVAAAATTRSDPPAPAPLSRREWGNLGLVVLITQLLRIFVVSALVGLFFVVLGLLIIPVDTIALWTTEAPTVIWHSFRWFGRDVQLSMELLQVAVFLAGFAGLYFAVYTTSDATLRAEFLEDTALEVRENLAVRAFYRSVAS